MYRNELKKITQEEFENLMNDKLKHIINIFNANRLWVARTLEDNGYLANLSELNLKNFNFSDTELNNINFFKTDLQDAQLQDCYFDYNDLKYVNLKGADLTRSYLVRADLTGANLERATLRSANLQVADLTGANLTGANLTGANLRNANLSNANLARADLTWADLEGADLTGADLTGADLKYTWLLNTVFHFTNLNETNSWDDKIIKLKNEAENKVGSYTGRLALGRVNTQEGRFIPKKVFKKIFQYTEFPNSKDELTWALRTSGLNVNGKSDGKSL